MYINFGSMGNVRATRALFDMNGASEVTFPVQSKKEGHIGEIHFISDKDGNGSIEWCKGNRAKGHGVKIDLEELLNLLEAREAESGK